MARLQSRSLFFVTSPRTPMKMQPEIQVLVNEFSGKVWNVKTQEEFMKRLIQDPNFEGNGSIKDLAFSARDRITRGPKALGFVDLKPIIKVTEAGKTFLDNKNSEEALLRQLLKFQLPSPYHTETEQLGGVFCVKPYLEIFRLIYTLEKVTFDEIMIFGMQLTNYKKFNEIVLKIKAFRQALKASKKSYKTFISEYQENEITEIYKYEIIQGKTKTRESKDASLSKFIRTKASNMRDYTDACFRYIRSTGMVSISHRGKSLSILPEKKEEVEFFLNNIDRKPIYVENEEKYKKYLFNAELPILYTDSRENLQNAISKTGYTVNTTETVVELKKILKEVVTQRKKGIIKEQIQRLKSYQDYADIIEMFKDIKENNLYDTPLMLEWNTWRAMTMLNGGTIKANLKFDDNGQPMSTASGNMADIVCDYGEFSLAIEVTMQAGQRQYEMEGEPVSRHLAKLKKECNKPAYCFFIAPKINESCIAHFYTLHLANIAFYGGTSVIIPIELDVFKAMIEQSKESHFTPNPEHIKRFCEYSLKIAKISNDEIEWYNEMKRKALNWLVA